MSNIELIICLLLLFMAVPDLCRKLGRPALVFSAFVIFGVLLLPFASAPVASMLDQAGRVGFLLLLFEVGLEIELPRLREFLGPLRRAVTWAILAHGTDARLTAWLVLTGLFMTIPSLLLLPSGGADTRTKSDPALPTLPKENLAT